MSTMSTVTAKRVVSEINGGNGGASLKLFPCLVCSRFLFFLSAFFRQETKQSEARMIHACWCAWRVRHSSAATSPIVRAHVFPFFSTSDVSLSSRVRVGQLTQVVCEQHAAPFKSDAMSWGVTAVADERMTPLNFGDFKSEERKKTEQAAIEYISEPSQSRQISSGTDTFGIAATVAAPGTGKTRLLDDLLRATVPTTHYNHFLRLPITFNGKTAGVFTHPVAVRALLQFVCGTTRVTAKRLLRTLDVPSAICLWIQ
jgi:hypothetical protein